MKTSSRLFYSALTVALLLCGSVCGLVTQAYAADPFYLGSWKIVSAVVAPWWEDAGQKPDDKEMKSLLGKIITILPKAIRGPRDFGCAGPRYKLDDYPADMLFQGAFGEMQRRNKSVDPVKVAATVGFRGAPAWKTLETGCAFEIEYHFMDPNTAAIGLNNYVYTLKKQAPQKP